MYFALGIIKLSKTHPVLTVLILISPVVYVGYRIVLDWKRK